MMATTLNTKAPTVAKVLSNLPLDKLKKVNAYAKTGKPFNHGFYWHSPEGVLGVQGGDVRFSSSNCACMLSVAFDVTPDRSATGWFGAKTDEKLLDALKFFAATAGGEKGMHDFVVELKTLETSEVKQMVEDHHKAALREFGRGKPKAVVRTRARKKVQR